MSILIRNGRMINPASGFDGRRDILIEDAKVSRIAELIDCAAHTVIDAKGMIVLPGLVDLHVHFREPGGEHKETIIGGCVSAAKGGFTSVFPMPNTNPPVESAELVRFTLAEGAKSGINVFPVAAISKGRAGEELVDMKELMDAGAAAFSDDGSPVANSLLMRRALEAGAVILAHEEDLSLAHGGCINEGSVSAKLGLRGIPRESEEVMIARDVILAKLAGGHRQINMQI